MPIFTIDLDDEHAAKLRGLAEYFESVDKAVAIAVEAYDSTFAPGPPTVTGYYDTEKYRRTAAADRKAKGD